MIGKPENSDPMKMKQLVLMISTGLLCSFCVFAADEGVPDRLAELCALTPAQIAAMDADEREAVRQEVQVLLSENHELAQMQQVALADSRREILQQNPQVLELKRQIQQLRLQINGLVEGNEKVLAAEKEREETLDVMIDLMKLKNNLVEANK